MYNECRADFGGIANTNNVHVYMYIYLCMLFCMYNEFKERCTSEVSTRHVFTCVCTCMNVCDLLRQMIVE